MTTTQLRRLKKYIKRMNALNCSVSCLSEREQDDYTGLIGKWYELKKRKTL
jgi:hypothetical protein